MFDSRSGILQLMSQIRNPSPVNYEASMGYPTYKYPTLSNYFINAMHEKKTLLDLERYSHIRTNIIAKFIQDADGSYLSESFNLGEETVRSFFLSLIKNPNELAKDIPFFFYKQFNDEINAIWDSAKEKFEMDTQWGRI